MEYFENLAAKMG
jgi:hypothetical protein